MFHRICKLLHYGCKPVFVFDGQTPDIKKNTVVCYFDNFTSNILDATCKKKKNGGTEIEKDCTTIVEL